MSCRVYFDTAPIIYFLENRPQWYDKQLAQITEVPVTLVGDL